MEIKFRNVLGLLVLMGLLAAGCATSSTSSAPVNPRPFYNDSWWGTDPVCSPGCPSGMSPSW
jgi:hypothetical protein